MPSLGTSRPLWGAPRPGATSQRRRAWAITNPGAPKRAQAWSEGIYAWKDAGVIFTAESSGMNALRRLEPRWGFEVGPGFTVPGMNAFARGFAPTLGRAETRSDVAKETGCVLRLKASTVSDENEQGFRRNRADGFGDVP